MQLWWATERTSSFKRRSMRDYAVQYVRITARRERGAEVFDARRDARRTADA